MPEGKTIYDSEAVQHVPDAREFTIVSVPLPRLTVKARRNSQGNEGEKMRRRRGSLFTNHPEWYDVYLHTAISRLAFFDCNLDTPHKHKHCDFLKRDEKRKFFEKNSAGLGER
jgi:hypothetical protein